MSELIKEVQPVKVFYRCDNCNKGIVELVDEEDVRDDNGDMRKLYTYKCPLCGLVDELWDIKYPYIEFIETGILRPR